ncbi:MAG: helix-turn-helix domain-containing protein [bacterium]
MLTQSRFTGLFGTSINAGGKGTTAIQETGNKRQEQQKAMKELDGLTKKPEGKKMVKEESAWESDYAQKCILLFGGHNLKTVHFGDIGSLTYCRICGTGEWIRMRKEPIAETAKNNGIILFPGPVSLVEGEKTLIEEALKNTRWNQTETARILGIHRNTLRRKIKQFNIY